MLISTCMTIPSLVMSEVKRVCCYDSSRRSLISRKPATKQNKWKLSLFKAIGAATARTINKQLIC